MISVSDALNALFELVKPLNSEVVSLREANGRVLVETQFSRITQPPFSASAMDGYAVKSLEVEDDTMFKVIGESAAGHGWQGVLGAGQAVRIFTGAPVPEGADFVVIQEDVTRRGDLITLKRGISDNPNIRAKGADFSQGDPFNAPKILTPADLALLAAMNIHELPVSRRPEVAIISTGDELVLPGENPKPDQIIASNSFGLAAMVEDAGAIARVLPIARDTQESLRSAFELAKGADLVITIGGASVGDHDLVAPVAAELGMEQSFYKVAMRPGKPLMAGRLGEMAMVGLPGNPVSSLVCARVFILPMIRAMLGLGQSPEPRSRAILAQDLPANGPREHYMRAVLDEHGVQVANSQDSAMLNIFAKSNVIAIRPPNDPAKTKGEWVNVIHL